MASRRAGIGRGLSAILPEPEEAGEEGVREVPVTMVVPNPGQPRQTFDPQKLEQLAASVAAAGVIQPLVVHELADGRFGLIAGERRWRAAQQAGLDSVPIVIRDEDEGARLQTALIENVAREDLNPVEEARACAALVEELELSKEEVARRLGRSRSAVSNVIRLLDLPDQVLDLLASGELSEGHGRALLAVKGQDARRKLARRAAAEGWSVRELERRAKAPDSAPKPKPQLGADEEAALGRAEDAFERALGRDVRVASSKAGFRVEIRFEDLDELLALARSLRRS